MQRRLNIADRNSESDLSAPCLSAESARVVVELFARVLGLTFAVLPRHEKSRSGHRKSDSQFNPVLVSHSVKLTSACYIFDG